MHLRLLATLALVVCNGCAGRQVLEAPFAYAPDLIDGAAVFGETVTPAPVVDLLWVSPEMDTFVDSSITSVNFGYSRFRRLMAKMVEDEFFIGHYEESATYSAAQTFIAHKGNCLAYTNMFVALARQAGLDARYQIMDTRPTWDVNSGYLVRKKHVSVLLNRVRVPGSFSRDVTVDFNEVETDPDVPRKVISDTHAASMFYANLAVDQLQVNDRRAAFAYLKRAILTESRNADLWINLGALYSITGDHSRSQAAFETAMRLDQRDKTAISGLAKSLRQQGKTAQAERYLRLAMKYQKRNPYYHFAVAEQAYRKAAFEEALVAVNHAIRLKRRDDRFYALRAATAHELGDEVLARESVRLQRKHVRRKAALREAALID